MVRSSPRRSVRRRSGALLLALAFAGCGRIGYDPADPTVAAVDAAADRSTPTASDLASDLGSGPIDMAVPPPDAPNDPVAVDAPSPDLAPADLAPADVDVAPAMDLGTADSAPADAPPTQVCSPVADRDWIAHFDEGTSTLAVVGDRGGTTLNPLGATEHADSVVTATLCGSARALRFRADASASESPRLIQARLKSAGAPGGRFVDARGWRGIRLAIRSTGPSITVRAKLPDRNTSSAGGVCTGCNDHFQATVTARSGWTQYFLPWSTFAQMGLADRFPGVDTTNLYAIEFALTTASAVDVLIDDVAFVP